MNPLAHVNWFLVALPIAALLAVLYFSKRREFSQTSIPDRGPLICPFCRIKIAPSVDYLGQQTRCTSCNAEFFAPHKGTPWDNPAMREARFNILMGVVTVIGGAAMLWAILAH